MDQVLQILNKGIELFQEAEEVLLALSAILGAIIWKVNKGKDQLKQVIDKSGIKNEDFIKLAKKEGLNSGLKELQKLIKKKG